MILARRARDGDISTVASLWLEAAEWLRQRGYDQWQYPIKMHNIVSAVDAGHCWLIEDDDRHLGTVTLDDRADMTLWHPSDEPDNALYLHRLVVRRDAAALYLGTAIIDWASLQAEAAGKAWLRLDAWTSNEDLHHYYQGLGFRHVRTVEGPKIFSGSLFQRPAGQVVGRGPRITTAD